MPEDLITPRGSYSLRMGDDPRWLRPRKTHSMMQTKRSLPMGAVRLAVFGLALAALAAPAFAEADPVADSSSFLLYEGVLVTPAQGAVYLMQPGGGLAAVGLDGSERWSSEEAARPLAIVGDRLIAQADADGAFALVGLELESGSLAGRADVALPQGVFARIDDDLRGTFNASVSPVEGDLVVSWKSIERPAQAYLPSFEESIAPGSGHSAETQEQELGDDEQPDEISIERAHGARPARE